MNFQPKHRTNATETTDNLKSKCWHDILRGLENPTFYLLSDTNLLNGCDRRINCAVSSVLQQPGENDTCATEIQVFHAYRHEFKEHGWAQQHATF